ncbi:class I mannose-6-phosphate isomerase [Saccharomonospora sp. NPDC006951]
MSTPLEPLRLPANQPAQFYRGGEAIAALRGGDVLDFGPEDWVASTTTLYGKETEGLSRLPDGRWLREAVAADPAGWLGEPHLAAYGATTALLVKLLDAGQRLPVHFHPDNGFAERHFDSHFGKSEAWIVVGTHGEEPTVHAGFRETHARSTISDWVRDQDAPAMLGALNSIPVRAGDTVYIPAGLPHAIGAGVFVVELQQPTDFSLTIEWRDFLADPGKGHLGIGFDTALDALDTTGWDADRLSSIVKHTATSTESTVDLLATGSSPFFRAERLTPGDKPLRLDPGFAVMVVLDGAGSLRSGDREQPLGKGDTFVVPHAAGELELAGTLTAIRCRPPAPPSNGH